MVLNSYRGDTFGKFKVKRGFGECIPYSQSMFYFLVIGIPVISVAIIAAIVVCIYCVKKKKEAKRAFSELPTPLISGEDYLDAGNLSKNTAKTQERRPAQPTAQQNRSQISQQQFYLENPYNAY